MTHTMMKHLVLLSVQVKIEQKRKGKEEVRLLRLPDRQVFFFFICSYKFTSLVWMNAVFYCGSHKVKIW